jgi:hypothetical protein
MVSLDSMDTGGSQLLTLRKLIVVGWLLAFAASVASPLTLHAQSNGSIAQGFPIDTSRGDIIPGSLVSLKSDSQSVELATDESAARLAGIADQKSLLVISAETKGAQVVLSGSTTAIVSDINGPVRSGDKITASPIPGVGMIATTEARIVGTAQSDLDISKAQTQTITDVHNKPHTVHIGYIPIQVGLAYYQAPGSFLPPFVQNFVNTVAGKPVSLVRIIFCAILLLFSFISLSILVSSTVRSAMISLGRNPLAAPNIRKSLYQMGGVVVAIISGTLIISYFILVL